MMPLFDRTAAVKRLREHRRLYDALCFTRDLPLASYSAGLLAKRLFRPTEQKLSPLRKRPVYCVGSGKSLDRFDLKSIRDSTVILLNSAVDLHDEFRGRNNEIVWMSIDRSRIDEIIERVPDDIPRIVSVALYGNVAALVRKLRRDRDIFYMPRPTVRRLADANGDVVDGGLAIRPRYASIASTIDYENGWIDLFPKTIMLTAIAFALHLESKHIALLGFDLGDKNAAAYSSRTQSLPKGMPFAITLIESYLEGLNTRAAALGSEIVNLSPDSREHVLPKSAAVRHDDIFSTRACGSRTS